MAGFRLYREWAWRKKVKQSLRMDCPFCKRSIQVRGDRKLHKHKTVSQGYKIDCPGGDGRRIV